MAKIGGKILGSNIYLCKKLTFRNSENNPQSCCPDPGSKAGGEEIRGGFEKSKNSDSEKSPRFNFQGDPQP